MPLENGSTPSMDAIRPLQKPMFSIISIIFHEIKILFKDSRLKHILCLCCLTFSTLLVAFSWSISTNSMALKAFSYLTLFDLLGLCTCLLSIWIENARSSASFTFGYERFEVLAIFSSTILVQIGSLFVIKESLSHMAEQPSIHTGRLLVGAALIFICHGLVMYGHKNKALNHVVEASSSSWLQEHVAEISQSLCHVMPGLSAFLLPRINPFVLVAIFGGFCLIVVHFFVEMEQYYLSDTISALSIAIVMIATMLPISTYTGTMLLQTMPSHIVGQLDKCLREALTLDGVLEFRKEHFWTVSLGKLSGSLHVRIRRDANEQLVLAHLLDRLSGLVSVITIQVFKDDWTRTTTLQILSDTDLANMKFSSITNSSIPRTNDVSNIQMLSTRNPNYSQSRISNAPTKAINSQSDFAVQQLTPDQSLINFKSHVLTIDK